MDEKEIIKDAVIDFVRTIGVATYGKERWFLQESDAPFDFSIWYDRYDGKNICLKSVMERIFEEIEEEFEYEDSDN